MLFAVNYGGEAQLRRLVRTRDGRFELAHINPAWPTEIIAEPADALIMGRALFHLSARMP
ncbi:hypothetical protein [Devosia lacusdianchii]|uniref:hypothetical protein n=1 Tax=Devosia lacusdianchii TaxID=2917991 RepID=UPI003B849842